MQPNLTYSIVIETDNLTTIPWDEFSELLDILGEQIQEATKLAYSPQPEIFFVLADEETAASAFLDEVTSKNPALAQQAHFQVLCVPNGRYYELKNAGICAASSDIVVLCDSDVIPEPGWLCNLLSPFREEEDAIASLGCSYLLHDDWLSKALALFWFFPLRDEDEKVISKRPLLVNNCSFRREWLLDHLFSINDGFKVDCSLLYREMISEGIKIHRPPAYAGHQPLRGWRFLAWRAAVTGRDMDRKYELIKSASRIKRILYPFRRSFTQFRRVLIRIVTKRRLVGLPIWHVPSAIAIGLWFYFLAGWEQFKLATGITKSTPEHIPEWVEHS